LFTARPGASAAQHRQQQLLRAVHARVQRRRRQHQAWHRPDQAAGAGDQRLGHEARRHQPAHAVAQQHRGGRRQALHGVDDRGQVGAQAVGGRDRHAARARCGRGRAGRSR
jgi:hypothetical protein